MATAPISGWVVPARKEARGLSGSWDVPLGGGVAVEMEESGAAGRGGCRGQQQEGRGRLMPACGQEGGPNPVPHFHSILEYLVRAPEWDRADGHTTPPRTHRRHSTELRHAVS